MNTTQATQTDSQAFAAGNAAAREAIAILRSQLSPEMFRQVAAQNIIPVHVRDAGPYAEGASSAWGDAQAADRLAARKGWRR